RRPAASGGGDQWLHGGRSQASGGGRQAPAGRGQGPASQPATIDGLLRRGGGHGVGQQAPLRRGRGPRSPTTARARAALRPCRRAARAERRAGLSRKNRDVHGSSDSVMATNASPAQTVSGPHRVTGLTL